MVHSQIYVHLSFQTKTSISSRHLVSREQSSYGMVFG